MVIYTLSEIVFAKIHDPIPKSQFPIDHQYPKPASSSSSSSFSSLEFSPFLKASTKILFFSNRTRYILFFFFLLFSFLMENEAYFYGLSDVTPSSRSSRLKSQSHFDFDYEEVDGDGDDDLNSEYPCPYCSDDFDLVDLCCHIEDEHSLEANSGICPVCSTRVGVNMVGHITMQHGDIFTSQHKLKFHKDDFPFERKELQDDHVMSLFSRGSSMLSTSKVEPDPLLSFLCNVPVIDESKTIRPVPLNKEKLDEKDSDSTSLERDVKLSPIPDKNQEEKTQRCDFVRGLVFSTIFGDDL